MQVRVGVRGNDKEVSVTIGSSIRDIDIAPEMMLIPAGDFWMGSQPRYGRRDEHPRHKVSIAYALLIGKFPISYDEWDSAVEAGARLDRLPDEGWGRGRHPIMRSGWYDACAYVTWLAEMTGKPYRLPSEAEWEYCCRAGTETAFSFGDAITEHQACFDRAKQTAPVGSYPANDFWLHDMHGNVCEWCADDWHDTYEGAPVDGSVWADARRGTMRVCRGGTWFNSSDSLRSAARARWPAHHTWRGLGNGFRVVREL